MRNRLSMWAWILGVPLLVSAGTHCSSSTPSKFKADASQSGGDLATPASSMVRARVASQEQAA